jgi:signal transduction histidine kinase
MYNVVSEVGFYVVIATVLAFVLLVIQAVWLLKTTGRREKSVAVKKKKRGKNAENAEPDAGDVPEVPAAEIQLYRFDKLATDIWFVSAFVILFSAIVCGFALIAENITEFMLFKNMALCVLGTLPFGFCFMIFTLSFARRIKAKNLRGHFVIGTGLKWIGRKLSGLLKKCKAFYYKIDVEMRIFISCISYLVIIMFCVIAIELLRYDASLVLFFMLVIVVLTVWAARRLKRICKDLKSINSCMDKIREGDLDCKCQIDSENSLFAQVADGINHLGDGLKAAVELSLKDERMKTELITNVSHDLKTPLTSIINYVDLLKKEDIPGEDAKHYLEVLDAKSQRLKQLTEDLVEAAKANSGNIELECMPLAFDELMRQAIGEFEDKFATRNLTVVASYPEAPTVIMGDGRRIYRIIENLLQNAYKYALEGTRIYADLSNHGGEVAFTLKNVSAAQLNISPEELMERFTRGDESRTTEGSGLGLSIAKDLTKLMDGSFEILLDGDLFKVIVTFPEYVKEE